MKMLTKNRFYSIDKIYFKNSLIFGIMQMVLSVIILGFFEYSISIGDGVRGIETSFWEIIFVNRWLNYFIFSVVNSAIFLFISYTFEKAFHPNFVATLILAVVTVLLSVFLLLIKVPYVIVNLVSFFLAAIIYKIISAVINLFNGGIHSCFNPPDKSRKPSDK